jgi:hypothetical protein
MAVTVVPAVPDKQVAMVATAVIHRVARPVQIVQAARVVMQAMAATQVMAAMQVMVAMETPSLSPIMVVMYLPPLLCQNQAMRAVRVQRVPPDRQARRAAQQAWVENQQLRVLMAVLAALPQLFHNPFNPFITCLILNKK